MIRDIRKKERLITLRQLDYNAGELTTISNLDSHPICFPLEKSEDGEEYFIAREYSLTIPDDSVYHIPFMFNADGSPWYEGNLFFYRQSIDKATGYETTEELRARASMLLDYKLFCEDSSLDFLDFSSSRPGKRPTYNFFSHLKHNEKVSDKNVNKRTLVCYDFYKFLAKLPGFTIDINRVEKTTKAWLLFENGASKEVELRSQTVRVSHIAKEVPLGYVRDEGEDLRPLTNDQRDELIEVLNSKFTVDERLIHLSALNTGARKQSILTMRRKHIRHLTSFVLADDGISQKPEAEIARDGTLMLKANRHNGIDTKFGKSQTLYFPKKLIEQIKLYDDSNEAEKRRKLFRDLHGDILSDDDMYLFLSTRGNCHYMAKDDPRFRKVKSRPKGEHTDYLKNKLFKYVSDEFPRDFTFHWQRATFAFMLYQLLAPLVNYDSKVELKPGQMRPGDEIRFIQQRLHHANRETTEHYLKLFTNFDQIVAAQEAYEDRLFEGMGF